MRKNQWLIRSYAFLLTTTHYNYSFMFSRQICWSPEQKFN